MATISLKKTTTTASRVPRGMLRPGFFRSPDMFAPAMMPVAAGKKTANTVQ